MKNGHINITLGDEEGGPDAEAIDNVTGQTVEEAIASARESGLTPLEASYIRTYGDGLLHPLQPDEAAKVRAAFPGIKVIEEITPQ